MKVILESSPYFKLISHHAVCRKVLPGTLATFRIVFSPDENKVRLEAPRDVCLQWEVNLRGWVQNRASAVGFEALSWFQWHCTGSTAGGNFSCGEDDAVIGWRLFYASDCDYPSVLERLMPCLLASGIRVHCVVGWPLMVLVSSI